MILKDKTRSKLTTLISQCVTEFRFDGDVDLRFDLAGQATGQVRVLSKRRYLLRINPEALALFPEHILEETLPHEVAHIMGFFTGHDKGHGLFWKHTCQWLGGSGQRCHQLPLKPAKKQRRFLMVASCGSSVEISATRFNRIQKGVVYQLKSGGQLNTDCRWEELYA